MDNNNFDNNNNSNSSNQSSDSFYSYNHTQSTGNEGTFEQNQINSTYPYQSGATSQSYQNAGTAYSNNGTANQQTSSAGYQNTGNTYYQSTVKPPKPPKKKREKNPNSFGRKLTKCAALALVFGLVSGSVMTGVNYAGNKALGIENATGTNSATASLTTSDSTAVSPTSTSSTYAATDISDVVEEVMPSIVAITNVSETEYQSFWGGQTQTYESTSCGSGIIVSQDDEYLYIATNNHVVDGATSLTVTFNNDATASAEVKGTDPSTDLAVVKVNLSAIESSTMEVIKVATIGDSESLRVGESCIAIGNALGYGQSVTTGVISALNREVTVSDSSSNTSYTAELVQTDAAINPGNSGGALLNSKGEVIGINSVKYSSTGVEGIGYAIPMATASPIIEELITKEKVDESNSAYLGIVGVDVTSDITATYGMPTGVYVARVVENSAAAQAGILQGDIITTFDGKTITSMEELSSTLQYYASGTTVDVIIQRSSNGQYIENTISVTLGKKSN